MVQGLTTCPTLSGTRMCSCETKVCVPFRWSPVGFAVCLCAAQAENLNPEVLIRVSRE